MEEGRGFSNAEKDRSFLCEKNQSKNFTLSLLSVLFCRRDKGYTDKVQNRPLFHFETELLLIYYFNLILIYYLINIFNIFITIYYITIYYYYLSIYVLFKYICNYICNKYKLKLLN